MRDSTMDAGMPVSSMVSGTGGTTARRTAGWPADPARKDTASAGALMESFSRFIGCGGEILHLRLSLSTAALPVPAYRPRAKLVEARREDQYRRTPRRPGSRNMWTVSTKRTLREA